MPTDTPDIRRALEILEPLNGAPADCVERVLAEGRLVRVPAGTHLFDGNEYYDVGGTMPDGSELELDITRIDGVWTVVETQRDIEMWAAPDPVADALRGKAPSWNPERIIESDQGNGVVIYEFLGEDDVGEETKIEVKYERGRAEVLVDEWLH